MSDVLIITPGSFVKSEYVTSLVNTLNFLNEKGISVKFGNSQSPIIFQARQTPYDLSKKINFKKMIWIDSDISWQVDDFLKLLESDKDIISGVYLNELGEIVAKGLNEKTIEKKDIEKNFLPIEVSWCGFGFMCLSKEITLELKNPFARQNQIGEDVSFCLNAREAGYSVYLDPLVRVSHYKTIEIKI
jgi:GT2 family glycosyltransferase